MGVDDAVDCEAGGTEMEQLGIHKDNNKSRKRAGNEYEGKRRNADAHTECGQLCSIKVMCRVVPRVELCSE